SVRPSQIHEPRHDPSSRRRLRNAHGRRREPSQRVRPFRRLFRRNFALPHVVHAKRSGANSQKWRDLRHRRRGGQDSRRQYAAQGVRRQRTNERNDRIVQERAGRTPSDDPGS
ncbi:unnamed protein product, partial [Nesidiocoris tenuis]